ncbi:uncharacterized protein [Apostichopus japonicus]|uniref:uncharacterized protein isoform X1 n=2 Tax=Stichopus japonicus TaxID=307972 RepID=UPI003AB7C629
MPLLSMDPLYHIVEFTDSKEIAIINEKWMVSEGTCLWPPFKSSASLAKALKTTTEPETSWKAFKIRKLYATNSYDKAVSKLRQAEDDSDLQTGDEEVTIGRKRKPNQRYMVESSSDEEFPASPKRPRPPSLPSTSTPVTPLALSPAPPRSPTPPCFPNQTLDNSAASSFHCPDFEKRVISMLTEIKAEVQHNKLLLKTLTEANVLPESEEDDWLNEFPLKSLEGITSLEEKLKNDTGSRKKLVQKLSMIGGTNLDSSVRRILSFLMSSALATKFNWLGRGSAEKKAFSTLLLKDLIFRAISRNPLTKTATQSQVEAVIKLWLKHAADRTGARKDRQAQQPDCQLD